MASKILQFIATSSERTRKAIAIATVGVTGIMLFFAWTAGVSARLPLLASELDFSSLDTISKQANDGEMAILKSNQSQAAVSPTKGLIASFQDFLSVFSGQTAFTPQTDGQDQTKENTASSSQAHPIDDLFEKIADENPPTSPVPSTPTVTSERATGQGVGAPTERVGAENLLPADELPGL